MPHGYGYGSRGKAKVKGYLPLNPPFDSRMLSIGSPEFNGTRTALNRGFAVSSENVDSGGNGLSFGGKRGLVQFLYNPNTVSASLQLSPTMPSPGKMNAASELAPEYSQAGGLILSGSGIGSVNIDLLYDRTYEVNTKNSSNPASTRGCHADVMAWYALLGVNTSVSDQVTTSNAKIGPDGVLTTTQTTTETKAALRPQNFILWQEIGLFMGPMLQFAGVVNSLSVTYTHFTHELVPIRCQVSIGMLLLPGMSGTLNSVFSDPNQVWSTTSSTSKLAGSSGSSPQTKISTQGSTPTYGTGGQRGFSY